MNYRHLPIAGLILTALVSAGFVSNLSSAAGDPPRISGGTFEASGVVHVPSTHGVLFVDDGRTREVFWMELNADGSQKGTAIPVPLDADVTDLEGITHDGTNVYVVGSQSKRTGFDGDGLLRFRFNAAAGRIEGVERIQGLKQWLAANVAELEGSGSQIGDAALNIEGLAWDPKRERLLLGLRAPVVEGHALIVPLQFKSRSDSFRADNLMVEARKAIRLPLNGAGIRSLEYDAPSDTFRIITGAGNNSEDRDFRVVEWTGDGSTVHEVTRYSSRLKPEGITRATIEGRPRTVIVFDTGRFTLLD
jgi:hypothetical protein